MATKKTPPKKTTRKYTKRAKPDVVAGSISPGLPRRFETNNDGNARWNILFSAGKLRNLAIQIALHGNTESMRLQEHIHWLNYFAERLTMWAGMGGKYEPSKEALTELSGVINNRAWWNEAHTERRATPNKEAQAVADALHGEFGPYFDELIELSLSTSNGHEVSNSEQGEQTNNV